MKPSSVAFSERPRSQKSFAMGLRERGFEAVKGAKGVRCWAGLRPREEGDVGGGWRIGGAFSQKVPMDDAVVYATYATVEPREEYPPEAPSIRHPPPESASPRRASPDQQRTPFEPFTASKPRSRRLMAKPFW